MDERPDEGWLAEVGQAASRDAGGVPVELLGGYLQLLADAARSGRRANRAELEAVGRLGREAAERRLSAGRVVNLYLSAALRLWQQLPSGSRSDSSEVVRDAAEAVLRVVDDAVATLAEGYAESRRQMVRREETLRRGLVDDLVRGDADVGGLVERAEPFGIDLARTHQVLLAAPGERLPDIDAAVSALERVVLDRLGDRDVLVAAREGVVVVVAPDGGGAPGTGAHRSPSDTGLGGLVRDELNRLRRGGPWQVAAGRPYPGAYGIARSYEEAREVLTLAERLRLDIPVLHSQDLLVYRVLVRDQRAMIDLIRTVLSPLTGARGGATPLLRTLEAYFATGGVVTETGRRLHLSTRAVSYRLDRVRALSGYDPADSEQRFALQVAVLGAKLLGWPEEDLPELP